MSIHPKTPIRKISSHRKPFSPSASPCDVRDTATLQRRHSSFGDYLRPANEGSVTPRTPRTPRAPRTLRASKKTGSGPISSSCEIELCQPSPITPVGRALQRRGSMLAGRQKSMRSLQGQPRKLIPAHRSLEKVLKESCSGFSQDTAPTETSQSTSLPTERLAPKRTVSARPAPRERKLPSRRASLSAPVYKHVSKEDVELLFSVVCQSKTEHSLLGISKKEPGVRVNEKPGNKPDVTERRPPNGRIYVNSKHGLGDILKTKEEVKKTLRISKSSSSSHSKSTRKSKDSNSKSPSPRSGAGKKGKKNRRNKSGKEVTLSPKKQPGSPPVHFVESTKTTYKKSGKHKGGSLIDEDFNFGEQDSPFRSDQSDALFIDEDDIFFARFCGEKN